MYGFDTAGSLAEETNNPRKHAPPAILRALAAAGLAGGLLIIVAMMSVSNIKAAEIGTLGLPFVVKDVLGETLGDIFLLDSALAITVCALAVQTAGIRMMFSMARDNRLPLGSRVARVSGRSKTPIVPALVIGGLTVVLLVINIGNQRVFSVLVSVAIILFYLAYLCVTGPMLFARLRGDWPRKNHGPYFSLGRWGMRVNAVAVATARWRSSTWPGRARRSTARTTGTSSTARSYSSGCSRLSEGSTTSSCNAASRPSRCPSIARRSTRRWRARADRAPPAHAGGGGPP